MSLSEPLIHSDPEILGGAELFPRVADEEVLQHANARRAVLLTADKDFGELVFRQSLALRGGPASPCGLGERDESGDCRRGMSGPGGGAGRRVQRRLARPGSHSTGVVIIREGRTWAFSRRPAAAADAARYAHRVGSTALRAATVALVVRVGVVRGRL